VVDGCEAGGRSTRATSASAGEDRPARTTRTRCPSLWISATTARTRTWGAGPGTRWPTPGAPTSAPSNSSSWPIWGLADALRVGNLSTRQCGFCGSKRFPRPRSRRLPDRGSVIETARSWELAWRNGRIHRQCPGTPHHGPFLSKGKMHEHAPCSPQHSRSDRFAGAGCVRWPVAFAAQGADDPCPHHVEVGPNCQ
jgi:hypothetical protein